MTKVKTILLSILIAVVALVALLFTVQFVDSQVNGKTHQAVINALSVYNQKVSADQQTCLKNYYDILNNTQFKILKDSKTKLDPKYTSAKIYVNTITACKGVISEIDKVKVPTDLPEKKQILFKELMKLRQDTTQVYIDKLQVIKTCGSNKLCYTKKESLLGDDPFKPAILSYNSSLIELKLTKKLTVNYMISGIFNEMSLKNQLKNIEKSKEAYEKVEAKRIETDKQAKTKSKAAAKTPAKPEPAKKAKK